MAATAAKETLSEEDIETVMASLRSGVVTALGLNASCSYDKSKLGISKVRVPESGGKRKAALKYLTYFNAVQLNFTADIDMRDGEVRLRVGCPVAALDPLVATVTEHVMHLLEAMPVVITDMVTLAEHTSEVTTEFLDSVIRATMTKHSLSLAEGRELAEAAAHRFTGK